ncbi:MAG: DUF3467 domain-containing protein [Pseudomonadota bacterium]
MDDPTAPRFTDPHGMAPGRFCTLINIGHTAEFFAIDFRSVTPEGEACLLGRFFLTPQHAKRLVHALTENISGYEQEFGVIDASIEDPTPGFN